ncbi:hypothetical protein [Homoserinibacter sp. GY 40078]|uniref:hypothetical protein n=1 Tax=Homoserinibacter sp. GY 40078 TaxID=2603275 RepID=UPI0011C9DA2E|nr:hypothetical protein [Homoserinibacter sp. GY 40078]TXK19415.1 hypothetical protein FVQ89_05825 [Homoserinibacter sp. GY 40078]
MAGALVAAFGMTASLALAPPERPSQASVVHAYAVSHAQEVEVETDEAAEHLEETGAAVRDEFDATTGIETLKAGGTNYDWAKLVLLFAGFPQTDDSVTVITRWMRQENYEDSWWNRNNPLNNGWGASYGPGGTGSNVNLVEAARNAADALTSFSGYSGIRAAFEAGADSATIEAAIWASPWASGHYANGSHWHYTPVTVVTAPASAWG